MVSRVVFVVVGGDHHAASTSTVRAEVAAGFSFLWQRRRTRKPEERLSFPVSSLVRRGAVCLRRCGVQGDVMENRLKRRRIAKEVEDSKQKMINYWLSKEVLGEDGAGYKVNDRTSACALLSEEIDFSSTSHDAYYSHSRRISL